MAGMIEGNEYEVDGGLLVLIGAATVEQTGIVPGGVYEFAASDPCLCRWGADDASIADGGFDFCVPAGEKVTATAPTGVTAINVIELSAASAATAALAISKLKAV